MITQDELKRLFHYDPETGLFTRLVKIKKGKIGDTVGCIDKHDGYVNVSIYNKGYRAHRLAVFYVTGVWPYKVDHEDGIKHHNWWSNLRICNTSENMQNQKKAMKNNLLGILGVSEHANGSFTAKIKIEGKSKHLGYFKTSEEAHSAYIKAKRELHPFGTL